MVLETWMMPLLMLAAGGQGAETDMRKGVALRMLRMARLTKISRIMRLLRSVPELLILLRGMVCAFRTVFFTMSLLVICLYVFGIIMVETTKEIPVGNKHFSSVGHAMWSLLIYGTLLDSVASVADLLAKQGLTGTIFFLLFVCVAAFTVLNMLIGVLCSVIDSVSAAETEGITVNYIKFKMLGIMKGLDENDDGMISKVEFQKLLGNREAVLAMKEVGVDVMGLIALQDVIFAAELTVFQDDPIDTDTENSPHPNKSVTRRGTVNVIEETIKLTFGQFLECLLQLRGSNTATVADITNLRKYIRHFHQIQDQKDSALWDSIEKLQASVDALAQPQGQMSVLLSEPTLGSPLPLLPIGSPCLVAQEDCLAKSICSAPPVRDSGLVVQANGYADEQPSAASRSEQEQTTNGICHEKQQLSNGHTQLLKTSLPDAEDFVEPQNSREDDMPKKIPPK